MGLGPCLDGLFRQSSLGVVTKMGFWLFPQPEAAFAGSIELQRLDDIDGLVDRFNHLEWSNLFNGMPSVSSPVLTRHSPALMEEIPDAAGLDRLVKETGLAAWRAIANFYGPEPVIRAQWDHVKSRFADLPGVKFIDGPMFKLPLSPEDLGKVAKNRFGIPSLEIFAVGSKGSGSGFSGSDGHIWFSAVIPRTGAGFVEANRVVHRECKRLGIPLAMLAPAVTCWTRSYVLFAAVPITKDREASQHLRKAVQELLGICAAHGWGEYRSPPVFQDAVMNAYSFNGHMLRKVNERIKDALDPNGILSAGRYGIWPRHLRKETRT